MNPAKYDWIIVGAGAAGISIAEILTRIGVSVLLIEKNGKLASETTRVFHEWLHTGTLYTLVPDKLKTTRYLLGAIDDLLEYYSGFCRNNLRATDCGLSVIDTGWFNHENIVYKYRARPFNPVWSMAIARSEWLIHEIRSHDWLRRRAGAIHDGVRFNLVEIMKRFPLRGDGFIHVTSPDLTMNSRVVLSDILDVYEKAGGQIEVDCDVLKIQDHGSQVDIVTTKGTFSGRRIAICCADGISRFDERKVKVSYAPMFVIEGISEDAESFVELDYFVKSCINMINKGNGYGLAGGISVGRQDLVKEYFDYCVEMHRLRNPGIRVLDMYTGLKKELVGGNEDRNYLYHINAISDNVWGVVLGKFTLMYSLAPEFVRRVYRKNPPRVSAFYSSERYVQHASLSNPVWQDIILKKELKNGND